ncbi:hypothetical protein CBFG_03803 [Clostridiales bacterium 1_7_47FAA]|nr:hypothetical protein CBFG_03803 [Clostridiales bacterium 1_7_47FAA]
MIEHEFPYLKYRNRPVAGYAPAGSFFPGLSCFSIFYHPFTKVL